MVRCKFCKTVRRKAKGENWTKIMCRDCYRVTDHFTWDTKWNLTTYVNPIDLYNPIFNKNYV